MGSRNIGMTFQEIGIERLLNYRDSNKKLNIQKINYGRNKIMDWFIDWFYKFLSNK